MNTYSAMIGWNWSNGSGEEDFKIRSMYFNYFVIISPWKGDVVLHLNINSLPKGCIVPYFGEIGLVVLEKM